MPGKRSQISSSCSFGKALPEGLFGEHRKMTLVCGSQAPRSSYPIGKMLSILLNEFLTAVGGTTINHNPLEILEGLGNDAIDGLFQAFTIIEINCYD